MLLPDLSKYGRVFSSSLPVHALAPFFVLCLAALSCAPLRAQEVIIDNDDGAPAYAETGNWSTSASTGYRLGTYRTAGAGAAASATWRASLPQTGKHSVYVIYRAGANRASSVKYTVSAAGGAQAVFANQQSSDLTWKLLGTWDFASGAASVTLDATGSSGGSVVVADAVKFVFVGGTPTPIPTPTAIPTTQELRGLWVMAWAPGFKNPGEVAALVAAARDHHYNALFPEVRKRGDCYYFPTPPNLEPRADDIAADFDPLQELINQAHPYGIEVHAWIVAYNVEDDSISPDPAHVVNSHPELLMKTSKGETRIAESYYLDPGNPQANLWNYNVVMDLVSNYDIDGIHFDYFRYPAVDSGYNEVALRRFKAQEPGAVSQPWPGVPWPPAKDETFKAWRRRQITNWLRATYADIMAVKPAVKVTAAVFSNESSARNSVFQDWPGWMGEHLLDAVCPMNYQTDNQVFRTQAEYANSVKNGRHCYMGHSGSGNSPENVAAQIEITRPIGCDGQMLFSYQGTNGAGVPTDDFFDSMLSGVYAEPAAVPEMPWKTHPAGGYLRGKVTASASGAPIDNATVTLVETGQSVPTDGEGKYAFIYCDPRACTVRAEAFGFAARESAGVAVTSGTVTTVNFSLDAGPTPIPSPTPGLSSDIIVDNDDGAPAYEELGTTWYFSASTGYDGKTYRAVTGGTASMARWNAWLRAGEYEVSVIYRAGSNRTTAAKYWITALQGEGFVETARVDQTQNSFAWVPVGKFSLAEGLNSLTLDASDIASSGTAVIADAVHFLKVGEVLPSPTPTAAATPTPSQLNFTGINLY